MAFSETKQYNQTRKTVHREREREGTSIGKKKELPVRKLGFGKWGEREWWRVLVARDKNREGERER